MEKPEDCLPHDSVHLIYTDDLCVNAQYPSFNHVEKTMGEALEERIHYYRTNSLRVNPDKTQATVFQTEKWKNR